MLCNRVCVVSRAAVKSSFANIAPASLASAARHALELEVGRVLLGLVLLAEPPQLRALPRARVRRAHPRGRAAAQQTFKRILSTDWITASASCRKGASGNACVRQSGAERGRGRDPRHLEGADSPLEVGADGALHVRKQVQRHLQQHARALR